MPRNVHWKTPILATYRVYGSYTERYKAAGGAMGQGTIGNLECQNDGLKYRVDYSPYCFCATQFSESHRHSGRIWVVEIIVIVNF